MFVAAELPVTVRDSLVQAQQKLRPLLGSMRWASPGSMHLTIRFLGELDEGQVGPLSAALRGSLTPPAVQGCDVQVRGLGVFPHVKRPRVLWAGLVDEPPGSLARLHAAVESAVSAAGLPAEDRPFHPHLTLARPGEGKPPGALPTVLADMKDAELGHFRVDAVRLMRSILKPSGAQHLLVEEYPLA
ncbi:MAG: RNA 2',3'-cyclic phosphodiesterase [Candidatus Polarisedimenticolia bacterium]